MVERRTAGGGCKKNTMDVCGRKATFTAGGDCPRFYTPSKIGIIGP